MSSTPQSNIVSNRKMIDNDTSQLIDNYIDTICENPDFLCKNRELCGNNTSIYTNVKNVDTICENIVKANECDNQVDECVVLSKNSFDSSQKFVSTSFVNIIVPITNAIDPEGNQKFLRLPPLSGSKKKNSLEICNVCACMDRFARSPGSGFNDSTSPGQNQCVYADDFEYYYYPLYIEDINSKLKNAPSILVGNYKVVNSNIIYANSQEDLSVTNLYDILKKNGISEMNTINFITNVLYKNDLALKKELALYLLSKQEENTIKEGKWDFYKNISVYYVLFLIMLVVLFMINRLKK